MDGHLAYFLFCLFWIKLNIGAHKSLWRYMFSLGGDKYLQVELLGHMINVYTTFKDTARPFPKVAITILLSS